MLNNIIRPFIQIKESPAGLINNVNSLFSTTQNFKNNSLSVFLNGLELEENEDYNIVSVNMFLLTTPPLINDKIIVKYFI